MPSHVGSSRSTEAAVDCPQLAFQAIRARSSAKHLSQAMMHFSALSDCPIVFYISSVAEDFLTTVIRVRCWIHGSSCIHTGQRPKPGELPEAGELPVPQPRRVSLLAHATSYMCFPIGGLKSQRYLICELQAKHASKPKKRQKIRQFCACLLTMLVSVCLKRKNSNPI